MSNLKQIAMLGCFYRNDRMTLDEVVAYYDRVPKERLAKVLEDLLEQHWICEVGEGRYRITKKGRDAYIM